MAITSKQIGWSQESNLLWQISKQLNTLTGISGTNFSNIIIALSGKITNEQGVPAFYADTFINIPAAGQPGRLFVSTDTFAFYRDNGVGWDLIGGPGTGTITGAGTTGKYSLFSGSSVIGDGSLTEGVSRITSSKEFEATKLIATGGTASEILAANGSVITAGTNITIAGGTISAAGGVSTNIYNTDGTLNSDRIITASARSITIIGGKEDVVNEEISLKLQTSTNSKEAIVFSLVNTAVSGRHYKLRSLLSGNFDIRNITNGINIISAEPTGNLTFSGFIKQLTNQYFIGQISLIDGIWFAKSIPSASNYTIASDATDTYINNQSGGGIYFRINNANKALLTQNGRLLLGTTTEGTYNLDIVGNIRASTDFQFGSSAYVGNVVGCKQETNPTGGNSFYTFYAAGSTATSGMQLIHRGDRAGLIIGTSTSGLIFSGSSAQGGIEFAGYPLRLKMGLGANFIGNLVLSTFPANTNTFTIATQIQNSHEFAEYLVTNSFFIGGNSGTLNRNITNYFFGGGKDVAVNTQTARSVTFYATFPGTGQTNSPGGHFIITGGRGNGAGAAGDVIIQTSTQLGSGTTLQTLTNRWFIKNTTGTFSNIASPNASAQVQIDSTTQGFLPPRMTTTEKNAIVTPAAGLVVYDTDLAKLCVYTTAWETITSS